MLRLICLGLLLLLTGCGLWAKVPPDQAIRLAIAQQLASTQQTLAVDLGLASSQSAELAPNFNITQLEVTSREKIAEAQSPGQSSGQSSGLSPAQLPGSLYHVRGSFSATLTPSERPSRQAPIVQKSPFDLYLSSTPDQHDTSVETWFWVKPEQVPLLTSAHASARSPKPAQSQKRPR